MRSIFKVLSELSILDFIANRGNSILGTSDKYDLFSVSNLSNKVSNLQNVIERQFESGRRSRLKLSPAQVKAVQCSSTPPRDFKSKEQRKSLNRSIFMSGYDVLHFNNHLSALALLLKLNLQFRLNYISKLTNPA